jgi:hypothetical protein
MIHTVSRLILNMLKDLNKQTYFCSAFNGDFIQMKVDICFYTGW